MLNDDFHSALDDRKQRIHYLQPNSVVTQCPSVSTIVSLSDIINLPSKSTPEKKDFLDSKSYSNNEKTTPIKEITPFIYKKTSSQSLSFKLKKKPSFETIQTKKIILKPAKACSLTELEIFNSHEDLLKKVIIAFNKKRNITKEAKDLWNFYMNENILNVIQNYFPHYEIQKTLIQLNKLEMISLIICTDIQNGLTDKIKEQIKRLMNFHYKGMMVLLEVLHSITPNTASFLAIKIQKIITDYQSSMMMNEVIIQPNDINSVEQYSKRIDYYNQAIIEIQRILLVNYPKDPKLNFVIKDNIMTTLIYFIQNQHDCSLKDLDHIFSNICASQLVNNRYDDKEDDITINNKEDSLNNTIPKPYLKRECLKEYTLVLDLDQTLIFLKFDHQNNERNNQGIVRVRPGLYEFLNECSLYYELVIFSSFSKDYTDPIIDVIEKNKIYFDYRLYKEHTQQVNSTFLKDLSSLGRDLSKIIIIDHLPQNFSLHKDNGIFIKSFKGEDVDDRALIDLIPILQSIGLKKLDVRDGISLFKNDIVTKISSNFFRNQIVN